MSKTVSSQSRFASFDIPAESSWQTLRWIHFDQLESDFELLLADIQPRLHAQPQLPPLEIVEGYRRVAACYFLQLPGGVATLGGIRALRGYEATASSLLEHFAAKIDELRIPQVQALVDSANTQQMSILQNSIFHPVTNVKHLWIDLSRIELRSDPTTLFLKWRPAASIPLEAFGKLLDATFRNTLDCPALNGLRTGEEVLRSFLEGQAWDYQLPWELLYLDEEPIGCAVVNRHPRNINELVYIGLIEACRGRGFGKKLVELAMQTSRLQGAEMLVTAVDSQNWPACNIYQTLGFTEHRELTVWLPARIKISTRVAA